MCLDVRNNEYKSANVVTKLAKSYKDCPDEFDGLLEVISEYFLNFKWGSD